MNDFSLVEKIKILMDIIISSPLFLFCGMIAVSLLIWFIVCVKQQKKQNNWIFVSIWIVIGFIIVMMYSSFFVNLADKIFDKIFMVLYFPSLTTYITIILFSNVCFIHSLIDKKSKNIYKIINFVNSLLVNMILVLVIDIINKNSINIYNEINLYTNSNLLVLLELTSGIFASWLMINLLILAHHKLKKYDTKETPKMPEIIFEDV